MLIVATIAFVQRAEYCHAQPLTASLRSVSYSWPVSAGIDFVIFFSVPASFLAPLGLIACFWRSLSSTNSSSPYYEVVM